MMQTNLRRITSLCSALLVICAAFFFGCSSEDSDKKQKPSESATSEQEKTTVERDHLVVTALPWPETQTIGRVCRFVLEENTSREIRFKTVHLQPAISSIAQDYTDVFAALRLPETHKKSVANLPAGVQKLPPSYKGCRMGLLVNKNASVTSLNQLSGNSDLPETIHTLTSAERLNQKLTSMLERYSMDYKIAESNSTSMAQKLKNLNNEDNTTLIAGWRPHALFSDSELRFLKDPKDVFPSEENLHLIVNKNMEKKGEELFSLLEKIQFTEEELADLLSDMKDGGELEQDRIREWYNRQENFPDRPPKNSAP